MRARPVTALSELTSNQQEVLNQMYYSILEWHRPLDLGGRNASQHSGWLAQLIRRGLVESKVRSTGSRGSKLYRITKAGAKLVDDARRN